MRLSPALTSSPTLPRKRQPQAEGGEDVKADGGIYLFHPVAPNISISRCIRLRLAAWLTQLSILDSHSSNTRFVGWRLMDFPEYRKATYNIRTFHFSFRRDT
jgi:hypothetical protein